jgi:hypothetical protein
VRREARLFVVVLVLVVGPTAILSLLTARVLQHWQLIIERQLEQTAERTLRGVEKNWASDLAAADIQLAQGAASALDIGRPHAGLLALAAAFSRTH